MGTKSSMSLGQTYAVEDDGLKPATSIHEQCARNRCACQEGPASYDICDSNSRTLKTILQFDCVNTKAVRTRFRGLQLRMRQ